jgi:hypothetical protein
MTFYLAGASAQMDSGGVLLTFDCPGEPPKSGTVIWSTTLIGKGGNGPIRQLGWKYLDGSLIAFFSFDHVAVQQQNLLGIPRRVGSLWSARFPLSAIAGIGAGDTWRATVETETAGAVGIDEGIL